MGEKQNIPPVKIHFPETDISQILEEVKDVLESGQLILGKHTKEFERQFRKCIGTYHAIAVNSGSSALEIALRSLGVEGKKVMLPDNTFFATAGAVLHAGAIPHLIDSSKDYIGMALDRIEEQWDNQTAGVIAVHIGGIVTPEISKLRELCAQKNAFLLEDAAHAHGSTYNGKAAGSFGDVAAFSFFPTKVITSGEGGMIVTDNKSLAENARIFRDQGKIPGENNLHSHLGSSWRISELHAILGKHQLERMDEFICHRRAIADIFTQGLHDANAISIIEEPTGVKSNMYKVLAMLDEGVDREVLKRQLKQDHGVSLSGEVYATPLHNQPVLQGSFCGGPFPNADTFCARHICLPVSAVMTDEEAKYVVDAITNTLNNL
ncbi:DegT/DnrJ/EryC1/StrS family aminotransferase [Patescibacteria group bacterium]|nr:DegT/DnrJ/EryC1/StrS family aminotransferase [Patescibacteria group bacterium]